MKVVFSRRAAAEYRFWQHSDRRIWNRINRLLRDVAEHPFSGLGKPEALRHELSGWWSRRISAEHRLVYRIEGETISVAQCRFHY